MLILESLDVSKESVTKVAEAISDLSGKFDKTIDGINFWSDDDKDGTIFIQYKDGYATVTFEFVKNNDINSIADDILYQLNNTIDE